MARAKRNGREETVAKRIREDKQRLLEELEKNPVVRVACSRANLGKDFYYEHRRLDPEFRARAEAALQEGRDLMADAAESQLFKKVKEGDRTSIIFTLKNLRRSTYSDRIVYERREDALTPERERQIAEAAMNWSVVDEDFEEYEDSEPAPRLKPPDEE